MDHAAAQNAISGTARKSNTEGGPTTIRDGTIRLRLHYRTHDRLRAKNTGGGS